MNITTIIIILLAIPAFYLTLRYNMHMFQLNGYKNNEHVNWLRKNIRMQWVLVAALLLGLLRCVVTSKILDIVIILFLLLIITVYRAMKNMTTKKKLVYTPRVKRMITTILVLTALLVFLAVILGGVAILPGICMVLIGCHIFTDIVANTVNKPIEQSVNNYYINDAKKKIREVPHLKIIGVTGSYGKTSVKFYLKTLLQSKYNVLVTPESYNTPMGVVRTIRESLTSMHEIFVCEMGARHVGDIKEICDIVHPDHGMITSIGPQHLETFFNMENIKNTKFELADALPDDGLLFLNGDNEFIQEKAGEYKNKVFYYSEQSGEGYCASDITVSRLGTDFTVTSPEGETERFQMKLIGQHNVINVMGAIAVANRFGIPLKDLKIPVRKIQAVEHRMQIREHGLVTIIDDAYNSNPIGSKAAVETLAMFDGIKILITPGMVELGDKEEEYNYKFGTYAAACCDYILLVGKKHTEPILKGALDSGFLQDKCMVFNKLEEAIAQAYSIKGAGHKYILLENDLPDNY